MKFLKSEKTSIILILFGAFLVIIAIASFLWLDNDISIKSQIKSDKWGQFGDFIGGIVGTMWALAGVLLFYIALNEQRQDFKTNRKTLELQVEALNKQIEEFELQRKELESSRKVYEQQSKTIRIQQFESHFYSLLNVYLKIKENLNNLDPNRDYFKFYFEKMKFNYEESSEVIIHHQNMINEYVELFNNQKGHLSHYFKCFYRLIKVIDTNPFLEQSEQIQYSKILRSQLTDFEQLIMQYNSYSNYGIKARPLILKYNLLKHSPIFQKGEFEFYSRIQNNFSLPNFTETFNNFIIGKILDSFDMGFDENESVIKEQEFNSLIGIYFGEQIKIEITCEKDLSKNNIDLSKEQFHRFLCNLIYEKIVFATYTSPDKIPIDKYIIENESNIIFGIKLDITEGITLNLN